MMAISEEARHRLYVRLEELLGPEEATTMMEHLPPVGWADVATKRDVEHLEALLRLEFQAVESRVEAKISSSLTMQTRTIIVSNASMLAGLAALAAILGR
jgi:hypothetical protein